MRSTDEQLREIMKRAETVREDHAARGAFRASVLASCVCVLLIAAVCFNLPGLQIKQSGADLQQYGSLLLAAPYIGYIMVGILAFALGVCVTFLCISWRRMKHKDRV